jgi:hypothetical protein
MKKLREEEEYSHRDQFNSILADMLHSRFTKQLELINLLTSNISAALYVDDVSFYKLSFKISFNYLYQQPNNQYFVKETQSHYI